MTTIYKTRAGDTVDLIAWKFYGSTSNRATEIVLLANQGLSEYGPILPDGITITLPAVDSPAKKQGVKLWD